MWNKGWLGVGGPEVRRSGGGGGAGLFTPPFPPITIQTHILLYLPASCLLLLLFFGRLGERWGERNGRGRAGVNEGFVFLFKKKFLYLMAHDTIHTQKKNNTI